MRFGLDITAADVKAEAERRILARYPMHRQLNIMRGGGEKLAPMTAFIDGIRARSEAIEAMTPIPTDFRADRHWR